MSPAQRAHNERLQARHRALRLDPVWRATAEARRLAGRAALFRDPDRVAAWNEKRRAGFAAFRRDPARVAAWEEKRRAGILARYGSKPITLEDVLNLFVEMEPMSGCWLWVGSRNQKGYGVVTRPFAWHWTGRLAHRAMFESATGHIIPPEFDLHHTCRTRCCVRPCHLVPLEHSTHTQLTWMDREEDDNEDLREPGEDDPRDFADACCES
jgi:HNH endonuclease